LDEALEGWDESGAEESDNDSDVTGGMHRYVFAA